MSSNYHIPVLLHNAIDGLVHDVNGVYVDLTFGGGGHSKEILNRLEGGKLLAFDKDLDAKDNALDDVRFTLIQQNFSLVQRYLRMHGVSKVDGLLADLGVSSHQFNEAERGFSYRFDARLDMRMDQRAEKDAVSVLNGYEEADLADVFFKYGEIRASRKLARMIVVLRGQEKIETVEQLRGICERLVPVNKRNRFLAQVFQALRIEVNEEMRVLEEMLEQLPDVIKTGGRVVIITYHSLEDRLVKLFFKAGNVKGELDKDFYGNVNRPFKEVNRKPILPDEEEVKINNRARSAKMRIAERIEN